MKKIIFACVILFTGSCCKEGTGGEATLVVHLKHHSAPYVVSQASHPDTVWVKFNAKDSPGSGSGNYDTFFIGEAGEDHVHCEGLKCGDYFIFGTGLDTSIHARVFGGVHVRIKHKDRKSETVVDIPVAE